MVRSAAFVVAAALAAALAAPGSAAAATNLILDGGFEAATGSPPNSPNWTEADSLFGSPLCTFAECGNGNGASPPRSGTVWLWFGGDPGPQTASVRQDVVIPVIATGTAAELRFWVRMGATNGAGTETMTVLVDTDPALYTKTSTTTVEAAYSEVTLDLSAYADGASHTVKFNYVDTTHNPGTNITVDDISLVVNRAPVLAPIGNRSAVAGSALTFTVSATDPDASDPKTFSATNLPAGATFSPASGEFAWTPAGSDLGNHPNIGFEVTDGAATDSETIAIDVDAALPTPTPTPDPTPPSGPAPDTAAPDTTLTATPPAKLKVKKGKQKRVSFSFSSNEGGSSFLCALDGSAPAACTSPSTAEVGKGKHTFSVIAVDAAGNKDGSAATYSFKVKRKKPKHRHG